MPHEFWRNFGPHRPPHFPTFNDIIEIEPPFNAISFCLAVYVSIEFQDFVSIEWIRSYQYVSKTKKPASFLDFGIIEIKSKPTQFTKGTICFTCSWPMFNVHFSIVIQLKHSINCSTTARNKRKNTHTQSIKY